MTRFRHMQPHLIISGAAIREERIRKGLSVQELADKAGLSAGGLHRIEGGLRRAPHMASVRALSAALEVDISAFLREAPPAATPEAAHAPVA